MIYGDRYRLTKSGNGHTIFLGSFVTLIIGLKYPRGEAKRNKRKRYDKSAL